jgi:murE/murF fusion protein
MAAGLVAGALVLTVPIRVWQRLAVPLFMVSLVLLVAVLIPGIGREEGRMQRKEMSDGTLLIDDTYNANPDSVRAAIEVLAQLPGPRALVLGDMGEVGDNGPAMHREVGGYARDHGIDALFTLGDASRAAAAEFGAKARACASVDEVVAALRGMRPASVLVKGSRFMHMERVVTWRAPIRCSPAMATWFP